MKCPNCGNIDSKVIDSRPTDEGESGIRRRRECAACGRRFNTLEILDAGPILVLKKDGSKQLFDRSKILSGLMKACYKRPVTVDQQKALIADIERELRGGFRDEVASREIGEMVMDRLKALDDVSYVRFASVYREFKDARTFLTELKILTEK